MENRKRIWLGKDRALFLGELPAAELHSHAAPVLLVGLSGLFRLSFPDGRVETCKSALIDAGVEHGLDSQGEVIASCYLEPDAPETRLLKCGPLREQPILFDVLPSSVRHKLIEKSFQSFDLESLLPAFVLGTPARLDERIIRSLELLRAARCEPVRRATLAAHVHLSESRFNHLFSSEMGVSFRRYRAWSSLREVFYQVARRHSLTDAAVGAGLHDSAHLTRLFQNMIGLAPSSVLKDVERIRIVD